MIELENRIISVCSDSSPQNSLSSVPQDVLILMCFLLRNRRHITRDVLLIFRGKSQEEEEKTNVNKEIRGVAGHARSPHCPRVTFGLCYEYLSLVRRVGNYSPSCVV